jgi:DNA-binding PadR family transcriptional regulator
MSRPASSISPEYAILGMLSLKQSYGYEICQQIETDMGDIWRISLSQTYNILNRLEKKGLIEGLDEDQERRPTRRLFMLTPEGQSHFESWLIKPSRFSARSIRVEFISRLYYATQKDIELARELIRQQISVVEAGQDRLHQRMDELPHDNFNRVGIDLRYRQMVPILEWLYECREQWPPA